MFWFAGGGEAEVLIGSADLMHRNLDRRVEVLVPLPGEREREQATALLDLAFDPATSAWELDGDGVWTRQPGEDLQESLIALHHRR